MNINQGLLITAIVLYSTGHWIGATIALVLGFAL
jgi:hypothetical protein